jgi:hypothetical protein
MNITAIQKLLEDSELDTVFCVETNRLKFVGKIEILDDETIRVSKDKYTFALIQVEDVKFIFPPKNDFQQRERKDG